MRTHRACIPGMVAAMVVLALLVPRGSWAQGMEGVAEGSGTIILLDPKSEASAGPTGSVAGVVREVTLVCDLPRCTDTRFVASLLAMTGVRRGERTDRAGMLLAEENLAATGYFAHVQAVAAPQGDGIAVTFEARAATLIRRVEIRSGWALESEVRRRVFLRSGQAWRDDPAVRTLQERALVEYFESEGYFNATVDIEPVAVGPFLVDLRITVDRGEALRIDRVFLRGHKHFAYEELRRNLLSTFGILAGFTSQRFQRATEAVIERYREAGFLQARFTRDDDRRTPGSTTVDLYLELREGDRWDISFSGNTLFDARELLESLTYYKTGFIDEAEVVASAQEIRARYESVGRYFATVDVTQRRDERGRPVLRYRIDEGPTGLLRGVRIRGAEAIAESELLALLNTRVYSVFQSGGYLQRALLEKDLSTIRAHYRSRGHLWVDIPRVVLVGDNDGRDLYLDIHVAEGPQARVREVSVEGNEVVRRNAILRASALEPGGLFSTTDLEQRTNEVLALYWDRGYARAEVTWKCTTSRGDPLDCASPMRSAMCSASLDVAHDEVCTQTKRGDRIVEECQLRVRGPGCEPVDPGDAAFDVRIGVVEGRPVRVGPVFVLGNMKTQHATIRRELPFRSGDLFDYRKVLQGQARLRSLVLFDSVSVQTRFVPDPAAEADTMAVIVKVEEASTQYIEVRTGLDAFLASSNSWLLVQGNEVTWRNTNLLGRGEEIRAVALFDLDLLEASRVQEGEFTSAVRLVYFDPRFYLFDALRDPWEARTEAAWEYDLLALPPSPLRRNLTLETRVREEFLDVRGLFVELGLRVRRTETLDQSDASQVDTGFEPALILSVTPRVTIDRRDNPLNPSRGFFSELSVEIADDFIGVFDARTFTKLSTRFSGFVPLGDRFVFGGHTRFGLAVGGALDGFRSRSALALPLSERFALGGVTTLRGFSEQSVSAVGTTEYGGDVVANGALELRYPFLTSPALQGAVFVDAGQLAVDPEDLRLGRFRTTAGLGLRWMIADLLPLVVDYGALLDRRPGEAFGRLHFNIGYTF